MGWGTGHLSMPEGLGEQREAAVAGGGGGGSRQPGWRLSYSWSREGPRLSETRAVGGWSPGGAQGICSLRGPPPALAGVAQWTECGPVN